MILTKEQLTALRAIITPDNLQSVDEITRIVLDELINDDELKSIFLKLRGKINESKRKKIETKDLEIYYCYVVREIERRKHYIK